MSNENDIFSFDLNESLYFEKGQEVGEMLGISLEPEISIQSFRDYVSIRGVIELEGEYRKNIVQDERGEESLNIDENHSWRYLERIEDKDDQHSVFSHRFPVEISIPSYRVTDMNDIAVSIETFDYELPADNQLILNSTIEIFGISNQEQSQEIIEEKPAEEVSDERSEGEDDSFEFEFKKRALDEELFIVEEKESADSVEVNEKEQDEADRLKSHSIEEFLKTNKEEPVAEEIIEIIDETPEESGPDHQPEPKLEKERESEPESTESEESEESTESAEDTEERDTNYLQDLFNSDEAEESSAQMRIYIVQDTDTLETISERYEIPELQLLKQNRLEDDQLSEGQLLSISIKSKSEEED